MAWSEGSGEKERREMRETDRKIEKQGDSAPTPQYWQPRLDSPYLQNKTGQCLPLHPQSVLAKVEDQELLHTGPP